jgi:hypothetical protein
MIAIVIMAVVIGMVTTVGLRPAPIIMIRMIVMVERHRRRPTLMRTWRLPVIGRRRPAVIPP